MHDPQAAFETIIGPLEDRMIRVIWRIVRNEHDAEDAMQNALATICHRWNRVTQHPAPQALVLKICIDAAYDVARRRTKNRTLATAEIEPADRGDLPSAGLVERETQTEVLAAIQRLSRHQATAISLRVFEELPYDQIAASLGCSEATARKHVARARAQLRRVLAHHFPEVENERR